MQFRLCRKISQPLVKPESRYSQIPLPNPPCQLNSYKTSSPLIIHGSYTLVSVPEQEVQVGGEKSSAAGGLAE